MMRALTFRTGNRQERPEPGMKMKESVAHPAVAHPAPARSVRRIPKAYISRRKFYVYAHGVTVKWYRSAEILHGRSNYYGQSGKSTPFMSLHRENTPLVSRGHLASMVIPPSERIKSRHGADNIMARHVAAHRMEKTIASHEAESGRKSGCKNETQSGSYPTSMALNPVLFSNAHISPISPVDVTPRSDAADASNHKLHVHDPASVSNLSGPSLAAVRAQTDGCNGCDPVAAGETAINGVRASGSKSSASALATIPMIRLLENPESGPVGAQSVQALSPATGSAISDTLLSDPKVKTRSATAGIDIRSDAPPIRNLEVETIMSGPKTRATGVTAASEVQSTASLSGFVSTPLSPMQLSLPDPEPIIPSGSISAPALAKVRPFRPIRVNGVGYFGSRQRNALQLRVARDAQPPPQ